MDLSFYSILTLQEGHQKLHSNLREANSPCILTGCRVCPVLLSFSHHPCCVWRVLVL